MCAEDVTGLNTPPKLRVPIYGAVEERSALAEAVPEGAVDGAVERMPV